MATTKKPGRTLAAAREEAIKKAVKKVPRNLPPKERVARVKALVEKGAATPPAKPPEGWREVVLDDGAVIEVVAAENPYRGARAKRWVYRPGMTVAAAIEKGASRPDIRWDASKGHIKVKSRAHRSARS